MDIGAPELLIVLLIVVLLFGPGRLAGLGSELGKSIREFRQGLQGEDKDQEEPAPGQPQVPVEDNSLTQHHEAK